MNRRPSIAAILFAFASLVGSAASAQQASPETPPPGTVIIAAPNQEAANQAAWYERDLADAKARSRAARNALIGTSAAFVVGVIIGAVGASDCTSVSTVNQTDDWVCGRRGDVMVPLGGTIAGLSAIGMLTSGIILGVSNKRKREIQRDMRRSGYGLRPHWDIPSGRFVF